MIHVLPEVYGRSEFLDCAIFPLVATRDRGLATHMKTSSAFVLSGLVSLAITHAEEPAAPAAEMKIDTSHAAVELMLDYQVGKTYTTKTDLTSTSSVPMGDEPMEQTVENQMTIKMTVNEIADSPNKEVVTTYTRYAMRTETMGMVIEADSDKPDEADPALTSVLALVGNSITLVVDENNQTIEIRGLDEMFESMNPDPATKMMLDQMFSEEALEKMYGFDMKTMLPDKPVKAGDSWTFTQEIPMGPLGKLEFDGTYTLRGTTDIDGSTFAVINMKASMEMGNDADDASNDDTAEDPAAAMMAQIKMTDTKFDGTLLWDMKENFIHSFTMDQSMTMTMPNPGDPENVITIPSKTSQSITVEIK